MYDADELQHVSEPQAPIRTFLGICLIVLGVAVAGWLVFSVIQLLNGGPIDGLAASVIPDPNDPVTITVPDGEVILPNDVFRPIGILLVIVVYGIVAGVAATLLNGGAQLLQPDLAKIMRRMLAKMEQK